MRIGFLLTIFCILGLLSWAQKKSEPKIIRVGEPIKDTAQKTYNVTTVEKVGNFTLIRLPDTEKPEPAKTKAKSTEPTKPLVKRFNSYGTAPNVSISIKLMDTRIRKLSDIIVYITLTNKSRQTQHILFNKPYRAGFGPWYTECHVSRNGKNLVTQTSRLNWNEPFPPEYLSLHKVEIKGLQWVMKGYALSALASFSEEVERAQKLPAGSYELQIFYMGLPSNVVSFTML